MWKPLKGRNDTELRARLMQLAEPLLGSAGNSSALFRMYCGPELTCKAMFFWAKKRSVKLHFIQPGKPTQNAFVESFNGKFREYCLGLNWFTSIKGARSTIKSRRKHYNHVRPHRSLERKPPAVFAKEAA
jgi:putative transposase